MKKSAYEYAIARYEEEAASMRDKARVHKGMEEEASYLFYAKNADGMAALMRERMKTATE